MTLSAPSAQAVTVSYAASNVTALAGSDYQPTSGILIFNPGETVKTIAVPINGDATPEADETFAVTLNGATNAAIARGLGVTDDTVRKWRRRFCQHGLDGLRDRARPGRPRRFPATVVAEVKALACELPADTGTPLARRSRRWSAALRPPGIQRSRSRAGGS